LQVRRGGCEGLVNNARQPDDHLGQGRVLDRVRCATRRSAAPPYSRQPTLLVSILLVGRDRRRPGRVGGRFVSQFQVFGVLAEENRW